MKLIKIIIIFDNVGCVNEEDGVVVVGNGNWDTPCVVLEDLN